MEITLINVEELLEILKKCSALSAPALKAGKELIQSSSKTQNNLSESHVIIINWVSDHEN
jgi:hypothetical protein